MHCTPLVSLIMPRLPLLALSLLLSGCDVTALLSDPRAVQREADAKAVGSACRYGMRSIEDCYDLNAKASKAAVFAGWKEMDQYMRENKVDGVSSTLDKPTEDAQTEKAENPAAALPAKTRSDVTKKNASSSQKAQDREVNSK